jgi:chromosomal replication initiator protein
MEVYQKMNYVVDKIWKNILEILESRLSKHSFETWLQSAQPIGIHDQIFFIEVPDHFSNEWLTSHYAPTIKIIIKDLINEDIQPKFVTTGEIPDSLNNQIRNSSSVYHPATNRERLHTRYTFETFVVGNSNRFAHAASLAVAEAPAAAYNPFFVYGGVGLGKTHLMHAIGHYISENKRDLKITYITTERFTNELIASIQENEMSKFRTIYRNVDILLVDDIQFLEKKERTQEEFFHTFNTLYEANKQIIISCDRPPKEITTLEDRLRSRFEWGLIADIQPPDIETRIAILQKKSQLENLEIPIDILSYIASLIKSNIRELEGALIKLIAFSSLHHCKITKDLAVEILKDYLSPQKTKPITIPAIQKVVAEYYGIQPEELKTKKRSKDRSFPRHVAIYLARQLTDNSLQKIGQDFGGRDHSTVLHAQEKITSLVQEDSVLQIVIKELEEKIRQQ